MRAEFTVKEETRQVALDLADEFLKMSNLQQRIFVARVAHKKELNLELALTGMFMKKKIQRASIRD